MRQWLPIILFSLVFVATASLIAAMISYAGSSFFGDWQLVFQQMAVRSRWLLLALTCGLAVGLIIQLHKYERTLTSRLLGGTLLGLRLLLVLIIFLTLLEPMWLWSYEDEKLGRVVVAFDVSESMNSRDKHARLAEQLRWGRAIGMFGGEQQNQRVVEWISELESGQEPLLLTAEEEPNPLRRETRNQQKRKDLEETVAASTEYTRLELAAKAFTAPNAHVLDQLRKNAQTELTLFARDEAGIDEQTLKKIIQGEELELQRNRSDLTQALNSAIGSKSEVPLAGVVLVSDGRDNTADDSQKVVDRLTGIGVPIHTVIVGAEDRPRDVAIAHIDSPETVFEDDTPLIKSIIHAFGFENEELTIYLDFIDIPDREPLQQKVTVDNPSVEVAFSLSDLELGRHRLRIRTDIKESELRAENNSKEISLNVVDDRAKVLILEGEGRWEFRFLHTALQRDKRVEVEEIVFEQPFLGVLDKPFFSNQLSQLPVAQNDQTQFANYDCVIIGDVTPQQISLAQWKSLEKYVREEEGTLVLTAGKTFPLRFQGTLIERLLPIENFKVIDLTDENQQLPPTQRGFRFFITPDGEQLSMFQLGTDLVDSRKIWSQLPGHSWGMTGEAKGGATVYAAAIRPGVELDLQSERENGIAVQHFVGNGQVLWLGIDSTWRWRFRVGDRYHHRFWGQLVRWAVGFKANASNRNVRLGLTQSVISEGESTRIQANWNDRFLKQHPDLNSVAIVEAKGGAQFRKQIPLVPAEGRKFLHEADVGQLEPGEYRITLETPGIPWDDVSPEAVLVVEEETSAELIDISANRTLMEQIAEKTGGRFFHLDEIRQLPERFTGTRQKTSVREEIPLWSHWSILALFSLVAMSEWVLRKLNGLP